MTSDEQRKKNRRATQRRYNRKHPPGQGVPVELQGEHFGPAHTALRAQFDRRLQMADLSKEWDDLEAERSRDRKLRLVSEIRNNKKQRTNFTSIITLQIKKTQRRNDSETEIP